MDQDKLKAQIRQMKLAQQSHAEGLQQTMAEVTMRVGAAPKVKTDDGQEAHDVTQLDPAGQLLLSLAQLRSAVDVLGVAITGSTIALLEVQLEPQRIIH